MARSRGRINGRYSAIPNEFLPIFFCQIFQANRVKPCIHVCMFIEAGSLDLAYRALATGSFSLRAMARLASTMRARIVGRPAEPINDGVPDFRQAWSPRRRGNSYPRCESCGSSSSRPSSIRTAPTVCLSAREGFTLPFLVDLPRAGTGAGEDDYGHQRISVQALPRPVLRARGANRFEKGQKDPFLDREVLKIPS